MLAALRADAVAGLGLADGTAFAARAERVLPDLVEALEAVYGDAAALSDLLGIALRAACARPERLRLRDRVREGDPGWFQSPRQVAYSCYADRFADDLAGVEKRLDYLDELGVTVLHLMPLLATRAGDNDGGYAVADYRRVHPRLGTMADLERLADALHEREMNLCLDLVLNHTAAEHEWARRAATDPAYLERYLTFPDRTLPDAYERTVRDVFPTTAPGSFTWSPELRRWVWTSFNPWQWDLDYSRPATFAAMLDTMLFLANRGADILRLDAVPFLWKRLGTDCQNLPEAHRLLQAFRALFTIVAPGVAFLAESIVAPAELVQYLGAHRLFRPECDLAYHNSLMVLLWSTVATRDARLVAHALAGLPPAPPPTAWVTYLRCHDDIGWAIGDEDAAAVGLGGWSHRRFLADFFAGRFPGSYARGADFQPDPVTGDVRTSGSAASLAGVDEALDRNDPVLLRAAMRRLVLLHAWIFGFGGMPLLWMGDELAVRSDPEWAAEPEHAADNRWLHRPRMDWAVAARRHEPGTVEAEMFAAVRRLAAARAELTALRADGRTEMLDVGAPSVLAWRRRQPRAKPLLVLGNADERPVDVSAYAVPDGLAGARVVLASDDDVRVGSAGVELPGLGWAWIEQA